MTYVKDDKREQRRLEKLIKKMAASPHVVVGILQDEKLDDRLAWPILRRCMNMVLTMAIYRNVLLFVLPATRNAMNISNSSMYCEVKSFKVA
jgi:hypothetical protein